MPRSKGSKSSKKSNKQVQKVATVHQPDKNGLKDKEETGESYSLLNNQPNYNTFISPGQKNKPKLVSYLDSDSDSSFYSNSRSGNPYLPFNGSKADTHSYSKNSSTTTDQNLSAEAKAKQAAKQTLEAKYKYQLQSQLVQSYYSVLLAKELKKDSLESGVRFNEVYECLPDDYSTEIIQNIKDNVRELTKHPVTTLNAKAIWNLNRIQETFGDEFKDRLEFERRTKQTEQEEKRIRSTSDILKKSLGKKKDTKSDMYTDQFGSQARHDLYRSFETKRQEFSDKIDSIEKTSETLKRQNGMLETQQRASWDSIKQERKKYVNQRVSIKFLELFFSEVCLLRISLEILRDNKNYILGIFFSPRVIKTEEPVQ